MVFPKSDVDVRLVSRIQGALYRHILGNTFPRVLLPTNFRLLVQMRRGSSTSFNYTASLAYAIEHGIPFEWTYESVVFPKQRVSGPLDARSLSFRRFPIYTTHFTDALSQYTSGKAFVRLRDPYIQVQSHTVLLKLKGESINHAFQIALGYLKEFAYNLTSPTMLVKIVIAEDYFFDRQTQLRLFFDYLELEISDTSITEAISQYMDRERLWSSHPDSSPRNSYQDRYPVLNSQEQDLLDQTIRSTILGDYYPATSQ